VAVCTYTHQVSVETLMAAVAVLATIVFAFSRSIWLSIAALAVLGAADISSSTLARAKALLYQ